MAKFFAFFPPAGGGSANGSVGPNGLPIPDDSTLVGAEDPSGNLQPLQVDGNGNLKVDISSASGQPIEVQDLAAEQSLDSIDTKTVIVDTDNVTIVSSVLPTGAATLAEQQDQTTLLESLEILTDNISASVAPTSSSVPARAQLMGVQNGSNIVALTEGQATMANSLPVTIASDQSALPVTIASVPLPSGAATEATLAAMSAKLPATLGQKTSAASMAVVLSSDQSSIPVTQNSVVSTTNSSTAPLAGAGVFTGTSENVQNYAAIEVSVFSNVASAASGLSVQQSQDGTNWDFTDAYTIPAATGKVFSFAPSARFFRIVYTNGASPQATFRLMSVFHYVTPRNATHSLADTLTNQNDADLTIVQMRGSDGTNAVPVLVDASGRVSTNVAQINGVAPTMGNGVSGTGVQRVTIASDSTGALSQAGYARSNAPVTIASYASTPVTTAAYTQLVASTAAATKQIQIFDSSGQAMIIATGAAAAEVDQIYVPPGGGVFNLAIAASTRVSIKALTATASSGYFLIDFLG